MLRGRNGEPAVGGGSDPAAWLAQHDAGFTTEDTEFTEGLGKPPTARSALECGASAPLCHLVRSVSGNPKGPQIAQMVRKLMDD